MTELVFLVEDDPEGGYTARALGASIYTQGDSMDDLRENVGDAILCHSDDVTTRPKVIRLHCISS